MRLSWLRFARFRVWTETSVITGMSHEGAPVDGTRAPGRERYGRRRGDEAKASNRQNHSAGYAGGSHVGQTQQPGPEQSEKGAQDSDQVNHSFRDEALLLERGNCAHEVADDDPPEKNEIQQLRLAEPTFRNQRQPLTQVPEQQEDHDQGEHGIAGAEPEPARQIVQPRRYRGGSNPVGDILNDIHKRDQQQDESDGCNFSPAPQP